MAWVALDRAIRTAEALTEPTGDELDRWRRTRDEIHAWVLEHCVDAQGRFVQHSRTDDLDASLLMIPLVGFLPRTTPRVRATVSGIERELTDSGFVLRYRDRSSVDGLPAGEGTFIMCSFWLAQVQAAQGRVAEATQLFERLCGLRNDVGLLSEEYDPSAERLLGNMPQAFSHTALVNTAVALSAATAGAAATPRQQR